MERPPLGRYACPGCGCHYAKPPPPEKPCADLTCKHCGAVEMSVERASRICQACGICAICGSVHAVLIRNKGVTL